MLTSIRFVKFVARAASLLICTTALISAASAGTFSYTPGSWGSLTGSGASDSSAYSTSADSQGIAPSITLTSPASGDNYTLGGTFSYTITWTPASPSDTAPTYVTVSFHTAPSVSASGTGVATVTQGSTQLAEMDSTNNGTAGNSLYAADSWVNLSLVAQLDGTYKATGSLTSDTLSVTYNSGSGGTTSCTETFTLTDLEPSSTSGSGSSLSPGSGGLSWSIGNIQTYETASSSYPPISAGVTSALESVGQTAVNHTGYSSTYPAPASAGSFYMTGDFTFWWQGSSPPTDVYCYISTFGIAEAICTCNGGSPQFTTEVVDAGSSTIVPVGAYISNGVRAEVVYNGSTCIYNVALDAGYKKAKLDIKPTWTQMGTNLWKSSVWTFVSPKSVESLQSRPGGTIVFVGAGAYSVNYVFATS
ncbi:MAG TPA: hypothetical protein VKT78_16925 [Fimbriimonadaceae bacterium]|nr:hypothetical protein [Fimbriimonadaceae bacterium]